ncbi:MAG: 5-formyltetrahydrofolate cyclo-ligase [Gammaproteobacteria bacterium]|nr:5-formyltetrahydrofolate cyclo-ligase [Gammaproteobacteria bacterium]
MQIKTLRSKALRARRAMSNQQRAAASEEICKRVIATREFYASKTVGCYLPMADEVDTRMIVETAWRANKRIFVPVLRSKGQMFFCELRAETDLVRSRFGTWEPVRGFLIAPEKLDIVVTPSVALDDDGHRIGMGSGYFDRCFSFLRHRRFWIRPKLLGVAFHCQKVEKIAPNPWDIPLYRVITDS